MAGNTTGAQGLYPLLFGPSVLPTRVLFVMGHSNCSVVSFVAANFENITKIITAGGFLAGVGFAVAAAIKYIEHNGSDPHDLSQVVPVAIEQNVILTVQRYRDFLRPGPELLITGGVYDLSTQVVSVLNC